MLIRSGNLLDVREGYDIAIRPSMSVEEHEQAVARIARTLTIPRLQTDLLAFQRLGVAACSVFRSTLLAADTGTGKTIMGLATMEYLDAYPLLVVSPASMKLGWEDAFQTFLGRHSVVLGMGLDPREERAATREAQIVILNYDLLESRRELLMETRFRGAVFDEFHYLKEFTSIRTRQALDLMERHRPQFRLGLTATPMKKGPYELASQLAVLGMLERMGGYSYFLKRYTDPKRLTYGWDNRGASNLDELGANLRRTCMVRFRKKDVLKDLPRKRRAPIYVPLEDLDAYRRAERAVAARIQRRKALRERMHDARTRGDSCADLEAEAKASRADELIRMSALRKQIGQAKWKATVEWIEGFLDGSHEKLVVFAIQVDLQHRLFDHFTARGKDEGYTVVRIFGDDSAKKRQAAKESFQTDKRCRLIICSFKAAQEALTLTAASNSLTMEYDFSPTEHVQAEDRIWRLTQTMPTTVWYMVARGTIDDDLRRILNRKMAVIDRAMNAGVEDVTKTSVYNELVDQILTRHREAVTPIAA